MLAHLPTDEENSGRQTVLQVKEILQQHTCSDFWWRITTLGSPAVSATCAPAAFAVRATSTSQAATKKCHASALEVHAWGGLRLIYQQHLYTKRRHGEGAHQAGSRLLYIALPCFCQECKYHADTEAAG